MFPTDEELDARVARGAHIFDGGCPGWEAGVKLDLLDMGSTRYCVAAQVVCRSSSDDAYQGAMDELNLPVMGQETADHGFILPFAEALYRDREHGLAGDNTLIYAPLTDAWKRLILTRLAQLEATR